MSPVQNIPTKFASIEGRVAQSVEQRTHKPLVGGSNPPPATQNLQGGPGTPLKKKNNMAKITFLPDDKSLNANAGNNLRALAKSAGIGLYKGKGKLLNCHGMGMCGECAVKIEAGAGNLSPMLRGEEKTLARVKKNQEGVRLACQCVVHGDVTVVV